MRIAVSLAALSTVLGAAAAGSDTVSVTLHASATTGLALPPNFASFSYEISGAPTMFGKFPSDPRPSFVQLMRNLQSVSGGAGPNIRIGGNSADTSVWWPGPDPLPHNQAGRLQQFQHAYLSTS